MEKFYITTPIYYPSDKLHIGHSYCTVATDTMARYKRLRGYDVMFLTGTDEHGQKLERIAKGQGLTPKEYIDKVVVGIKELWKTLDISYDKFIRTTDDYHVKTVQRIFKRLYDQGDIYKSTYEGWYCTPCESFFTEPGQKGMYRILVPSLSQLLRQLGLGHFLLPQQLHQRPFTL